jgi:hypothetical protein
MAAAGGGSDEDEDEDEGEENDDEDDDERPLWFAQKSRKRDSSCGSTANAEYGDIHGHEWDKCQHSIMRGGRLDFISFLTRQNKDTITDSNSKQKHNGSSIGGENKIR